MNAVSETKVFLTQQQFRVLLGVCEGKSNKQIADGMSLSEKTIKAHVTAVMKALGVANRTQAILSAWRVGIDLSRLGTSEGVLTTEQALIVDDGPVDSLLSGDCIHRALDVFERGEGVTHKEIKVAIAALAAVRKVQFAVTLYARSPTKDMVPVIRKLVT